MYGTAKSISRTGRVRIITAMDTKIHCALVNFQDGGLRPVPDSDLVCHRGYWDFTGLRDLFTTVHTVPDVVVVNEAREYGLYGRRALRFAARVLSDVLGRPYVGEIGWLPQGNIGPAVFHDPTRLHLDFFGDTDPTVYASTRNLVRAHLRGNPHTTVFQLLVDHWAYWSGPAREDHAQFVNWLGRSPVPTLLLGDLNSTASGPHWPQRDWSAPHPGEGIGKGRRLPDGTLVADTAALDHLIGRWDPGRGRRVHGAGFHAVPELAWRQGMARDKALIPTVNDGIDAGGGLLVDMGLLNDAWAAGLVPGTFRIHVPAGTRREDYATDHRLSEWTLDRAAAADAPLLRGTA